MNMPNRNPQVHKPEIAVEYNELGQPVRVVIDDIDITPLVTRVQSITDRAGTKHEVVLSIDLLPVYRQ